MVKPKVLKMKPGSMAKKITSLVGDCGSASCVQPGQPLDRLKEMVVLPHFHRCLHDPHGPSAYVCYQISVVCSCRRVKDAAIRTERRVQDPIREWRVRSGGFGVERHTVCLQHFQRRRDGFLQRRQSVLELLRSPGGDPPRSLLNHEGK